MRLFKLTITLILAALLTFGCQNKHKEACTFDLKKDGENLIMHAGLFQIFDQQDGSFIVKIRANWETDIYRTFLVSKVKHNQDHCSNNIILPLNSIALFSATHLYMLDTLNCFNIISGFSNSDYTANSNMIEGMESGDIKTYGDFEKADLEFFIKNNNDLIMTSGTGKENEKVNRLWDAGIPVIENVEWLEKTALARAEWIKLFGVLTGQLEQATIIFNGIRDNYIHLSNQNGDKINDLDFLYGQPIGSTWYVPGKNSFMADVFKDAKLQYPWTANASTGSVGIDFETIFSEYMDAQLWIGAGVSNEVELLNIDTRFADLHAVKAHHVFNYNKRLGINGTTEFWEKSVLRCDLLLSDIINMTQGNDQDLYFYQNIYP